jgi:hypothetical protein
MRFLASRIFKSGGERFGLQLGAGVGADFAVQANFLKSRRCPFHDDPQYIVPQGKPRNVFVE